MSNNSNKTFFANVNSSSEAFKFSDIFKDTFRQHSKEDIKNVFSAGLDGNIPTKSSLLRGWQKPWIYIRVFFFGTAAFLLTWLIESILAVSGYSSYIIWGVYFMLPSLVVPFAITFFFYEMNIPRNIPIYSVIGYIIFGGIIPSLLDSIIITLFGLENAPAFSAGLVEEISKLLVILFILRKPEKCYGLNGLLVGAAVGCGFAIFESNGYVINALLAYGLDEAKALIIIRAVFAIAGHTSLSAMYGCAIALVKGKSKLKIKHLIQPIFLIALFSAMILHALWNSKGEIIYLFGNSGVTTVLNNYYFYEIIIAVLEYVVIFFVMRKGIQQCIAVENQAYVAAPSLAAVAPAAVQPVAVPQSPVSAHVFCVGGPLAGDSFPVPVGATLKIGRSPSCQIRFANDAKGISSEHCSVSFNGRNALVTDLGSSFGTFLADGTKMTPNMQNKLANGDVFYLASNKCSFRIDI